MAWMKPLVKSGWLATDALIPLVLGNGITDGSGGEPTPPPINWQTVTGASPLALVNALAKPIKSLTQYGKCVQDGTPTPSAPVDIVCNNGALKWDSVNQRVYADGTDEVLTVSGANLLDPSTSNIKIGQYYLSPGWEAASQSSWRTGRIPIVGGKTYAFWGRAKADNTISAYNRINWYTADGTNISPRPSFRLNTVTVGTAPSNAAFAGLSSTPYDRSDAITRETFDEFNWMFTEASAEVPYQPYHAPQTVTDIPMLLSVGDYKDEGEIISGAVTHKVGIKVFDGSEYNSWTVQSNRVYTSRSNIGMNDSDRPDSGAITCLSTHYADSATNSVRINNSAMVLFYYDMESAGITTSAEWNAYLAAQYAAGTPVIVLYPLAEETTEQTTAHSLNSYEGTTVVEADANVDPVTLSVEYASSEE